MSKEMELSINKDTLLCMSLSARPSNFGTRFHNYLYRELELNFVYKAFSTKNLKAAIEGIRALGIRGCAVSMPFKEDCMSYLDEIDASARAIESTNTIVNSEGRLKGYNTDYSAVRTLLRNSKISPASSFALLGSGGMAKAVACALRDEGFSNGTLVARNERKGKDLASHYNFRFLPRLNLEKVDLLINVTPIGMTGSALEEELPFSVELIRQSDAVFDVVAFPSETPLIQKARELQKKIITGAEVVALQAVEQFVLYTGIRPKAELLERASAFARAL